MISVVVLSAIFLAIDLWTQGSFEKPSFKRSFAWSGFWFCVGILMTFYFYVFQTKQDALTYLTAFVVEKSLSLDNLLVFTLIFRHFKLPVLLIDRTLNVGIVGAIVFRFLMIFLGLELMQRLSWLTYVLGGILLLTGVKILFQKDDESFNETLLGKIANRLEALKKSSSSLKSQSKTQESKMITVVTLVIIADILFAVDSIPAVFSLTQDMHVIYMANFFSILGLKHLYQVTVQSLNRFIYLQYGLGIILCMMGIKMVMNISFPAILSLLITLLIIGGSILLSSVRKET